MGGWVGGWVVWLVWLVGGLLGGWVGFGSRRAPALNKSLFKHLPPGSRDRGGSEKDSGLPTLPVRVVYQKVLIAHQLMVYQAV